LDFCRLTGFLGADAAAGVAAVFVATDVTRATVRCGPDLAGGTPVLAGAGAPDVAGDLAGVSAADLDAETRVLARSEASWDDEGP